MVSILLQAPAVKLGIDKADFGNHLRGNSTGNAAWIALSNIGSATLKVSGVDVDGANANDFSEVNNCGASLLGGSTCIIQVKFKPVRTGTRRATIRITDNALGSPHSIDVTGRGFSDPHSK